MPTHYIWLLLAILFEVVGTACLKGSDSFTKLWPALGVVFFFGCSFYFLTLALRVLPVGIVYAIWSGLGIVLITVISMVLFKQVLDLASYIGMGLIIAGVIVIHVFSKTQA